MTDLEKEHYAWLKGTYDILVKTIMGSDYYTDSIHVFDADIEAFDAMKKKIDRTKHNLRIWQGIAIIMTIVSVMLMIFK